MHYRKPVQLLQTAVAKSQALTRPVEPFLDRTMAGTASLASTVKTKVGTEREGNGGMRATDEMDETRTTDVPTKRPSE